MKIFQKGLSAAVVFLLLCLTGCGAREMNQEGDRLRVVTTVFPYYDFTRQIAGDDAELTMVVPAGMDSHSFEPTPADMRLIQNADLLICNGGAMEHWLSEVLDAIDTSGMTVVTMMDYVDTFEEEMVEGMESGHDHDHDHEAFELDEDGHREEIEYDEHIWTSPVNAMKMAEVICDVLSQMDPVHESSYKAREDAYQKELQAIDEGFRQVSENRKRSMIILGDKFPFRYLAEEYQLDYRAAFSGCSTDTEPSARTIAYLIDKVREKQIPVVYYLELSSHRVAEIIGEETGAQPLLLHSCHNVTRAQFDSGITYAELMRQNVENLRKGLDE
mgnify:CR=1 FL=1